ncbi:MAG TPA: NAD(P)/FAD-dependent oxidoreductase [Baekduia sp.]|nr:NAD(P)/FAD-dependent oxidoreductase [Baekduia sp.]
MSHQFDAIVIGGGLAGLRAARDLGDAGKSVLVLEAQDRLGGRVYYDRFADTDTFVEYGGGWINLNFHSLVAGEVERYSLPTGPSQEASGPSQQEGESAFRWLSLGGIRTGASPVPVEDLADMERGLHRCIQAAERIEFGKPWDEQDIADLDISWKQFVGEMRLRASVEEFFLTWPWSSDAADTNALDLLAWVAGFDNSVWRVYGESMIDRLINGTKSLVDALAADSDADIRLGSPVASVEQNDEDVTVTTRSGESFTGRSAVVAAPVNVWSDVTFAPPLSAPKREVSAEPHPGRAVKVWALLENVPDEGVSGWGFGQGCNWFFRYSRLPEGDLYVGFSGGYDLDVTDVEAVQRAARVFAPEARVIKVDAHDWRANEFFKGTPLIHRPGEARRYFSALADREGRVLFAGSDVAFGWNGWMDGALESGARAAREVLEIVEAAVEA